MNILKISILALSLLLPSLGEASDSWLMDPSLSKNQRSSFIKGAQATNDSNKVFKNSKTTKVNQEPTDGWLLSVVNTVDNRNTHGIAHALILLERMTPTGLEVWAADFVPGENLLEPRDQAHLAFYRLDLRNHQVRGNVRIGEAPLRLIGNIDAREAHIRTIHVTNAIAELVMAYAIAEATEPPRFRPSGGLDIPGAHNCETWVIALLQYVGIDYRQLVFGINLLARQTYELAVRDVAFALLFVLLGGAPVSASF